MSDTANDNDGVAAVTTGFDSKRGNDQNPPTDSRVSGTGFENVQERVIIPTPIIPPGPWQPDK